MQARHKLLYNNLQVESNMALSGRLSLEIHEPSKLVRQLCYFTLVRNRSMDPWLEKFHQQKRQKQVKKVPISSLGSEWTKNTPRDSSLWFYYSGNCRWWWHVVQIRGNKSRISDQTELSTEVRRYSQHYYSILTYFKVTPKIKNCPRSF